MVYTVCMCFPVSDSVTPNFNVPLQSLKDELRTIFLEEEVRELKNALHSERSKNGRLMKVIEQKVLEQTSSEATSSTAGKSISKPSTDEGRARGEVANPATLQEYESMIKRLQGKLDQKTHEVCSLLYD